MTNKSSGDVRSDELSLECIKGIDPDLENFLNDLDYTAELPFDPDQWDLNILETLYLMNPMVIIQRDTGCYVLGCGIAFVLANAIQQLRKINKPFPVWIVVGKKLSLKQKLSFLAAELIGTAALHRTRQNGAHTLFKAWQAIEEKSGLKVFRQDACKFSGATGFSYSTTDRRR